MSVTTGAAVKQKPVAMAGNRGIGDKKVVAKAVGLARVGGNWIPRWQGCVALLNAGPGIERRPTVGRPGKEKT